MIRDLVLGLYSEFTCLAERCPATCCSGWRIVVDEEAYRRFVHLSDRELRQDILDNVIERDGERRFATRPGGDCAMLDADGLCRIQRNMGEQALCNTCRKYPRLSADLSGQGQGVWLSFAASCPVVASYILDGRTAWYVRDEAGRYERLSAAQTKALWKLVGDPENVQFWAEKERIWEIYMDVALDVLDVLLQFPGFPYLDDAFDLYEREAPDEKRLAAFEQEMERDWQPFARQYLSYRYPSRYLEFPQETRQERICQGKGELLLMRVMLCSRYYLHGCLKRDDWMEILHWVYRFCAHGDRMAKKVHQIFTSFNGKFL